MNMKVQRTIKLVLKPTEEQKQILLETIEQYKFAYNYTCKIGWEAETWNGVELHKLTYYTNNNIGVGYRCWTDTDADKNVICAGFYNMAGLFKVRPDAVDN
jgi:predicted transposase